MGQNLINDTAAIELLDLIVQTPSVNPSFSQPGDDPALFNEQRLAEALAGWFGRNGIAVEIDQVYPARPNIIARIKGTSNGPSMLWEGHLDTVQVTGMQAPFLPVVRDGKLYGRGAVDDGGCVAAFMLAIRELSANPPPGDVTFVGAVDEEFNYKGVLHHLRRKEKADLGIAGEPTNLRVVRACKGCVRWYVEVHGVPAHTSNPQNGISAVDGARLLLKMFEAEIAKRTFSHELVGRSTLTCTAFEAGDGPNTVPSSARLRFDYRYLPHEAGLAVWNDFKALAEQLPSQMQGIAVTVMDPFIDSSAMDVPAASEIVTAMGAICASYGIDPTPQGVPYGSDATKMVNDGGIPTIVFGPGDIAQAHALDEHVEIAQVTQAAQMLVDLAHSLR